MWAGESELFSGVLLNVFQGLFSQHSCHRERDAGSPVSVFIRRKTDVFHSRTVHACTTSRRWWEDVRALNSSNQWLNYESQHWFGQVVLDSGLWISIPGFATQRIGHRQLKIGDLKGSCCLWRAECRMTRTTADSRQQTASSLQEESPMQQIYRYYGQWSLLLIVSCSSFVVCC